MMEGQRVGQSPNQLPMLVLEEPSAGLADDKVYVFHRQHIYIGRAIENSLVVNESSVSRQHSEITFRGMHASRTHASERWALTDTSRNGTFVNDKLVIPGQTVMLESGDKIAVGSRIFIVRGQPQE